MLCNLGAISGHENFGNQEDASEGRGINWLKLKKEEFQWR